MTPNPKRETNESQMHLDAMLYVLEDPALDREAYEASLEDNSQLAEILADAVAVCQLTQSVTSWEKYSIPSAVWATPTASNTHPVRGWRFVGSIWALAASILIAGFLVWQVFNHKYSGSSEIANLNAESLSLDNLVLAWGDMQSDRPSFQQGREQVEIESESSLVMTDPVGERDVPEWIVLATSDMLDGGLETRDGKGLLQ